MPVHWPRLGLASRRSHGERQARIFEADGPGAAGYADIVGAADRRGRMDMPRVMTIRLQHIHPETVELEARGPLDIQRTGEALHMGVELQLQLGEFRRAER